MNGNWNSDHAKQNFCFVFSLCYVIKSEKISKHILIMLLNGKNVNSRNENQ